MGTLKQVSVPMRGLNSHVRLPMTMSWHTFQGSLGRKLLEFRCYMWVRRLRSVLTIQKYQVALWQLGICLSYIRVRYFFAPASFITLTLSYTIYNKLNCLCYNIVAYYQLSNEKRDIIDNVAVTEGTSLNWRMMEYVIRQVMNLDNLVERHDAVNYDQGRAYAFLHTLTWSDCNKNFSVTIFRYFIHFVSFQDFYSFFPN